MDEGSAGQDTWVNSGRSRQGKWEVHDELIEEDLGKGIKCHDVAVGFLEVGVMSPTSIKLVVFCTMQIS